MTGKTEMMNWLTAQSLGDGVVHWWGDNGLQPDCALAKPLSQDEGTALISLLDPTLWVGAYLIPLTDNDQPIRRETIREAIRADGPTIGPTLQATAKGLGRDPQFLNNAYAPSSDLKA
jgi:hypothetical protein